MRKFRVVLVEPEHPHNVGFVARAMHCYALPELYIVYPKRDKVLDKSYHTAANSHDILDNAKVVHKFEDAIGDCSCAVAYSRRIFASSIKHTMVQNLSDMLPEDGTIALVFGRESCGLALEEVNACTYQCEIPVPGLMSLNLGQAVSISLYELCRSGALANGEGRAKRTTRGVAETGPATIQQIDGFKKFLDRYLTGQYHDQAWRDSFLNTLLQRLHPTRNELSALFGLLRNLAGKPARLEHAAEKAAKQNPESKFIGLDDYLPFLYPDKTWIHDKPFGKRGGLSYRIRPDFLCEEEKLIIEFDGLQHYTNPLNIRKDRENQVVYESFGFTVIRIPYFINLTTDVVKEMFGINTHGNMFDPNLPSMSVKWQNTPAFCCVNGIRRMVEDFKRYPQQYEVNIRQLEADNDEELSGANLLKAAMLGKL
jgi:tRNA/rRNA methyltransferase/tRNA (cytidine32/uridine32-2'-O)-methyltransferase